MITDGPDELPNPYKNQCREILSALVCYDNDLHRVKVELRQLQQEFKDELKKIEFRCDQLRKHPCKKKSEHKFQEHIATIDEVNQCFTEKITEIEKQRDEILAHAQQCLKEYETEKCDFKKFHEHTVTHLKRHAMECEDLAVLRICERDIAELQKRFAKEAAHLTRCENELQSFIKMLRDSEPPCTCCDIKEYEWVPQGKGMRMVDELAAKLKSDMGSALKRAFAQMHLQQPEDPMTFLASYLMNLQKNEDMQKKKIKLMGTP